MDTITDPPTTTNADHGTDGSAKEQVQDAAGAAQEKLHEAAGEAKQKAADATDQAKGTIRSQIDDRSTKFAGQAKDAAGDLRSVGDELRSKGRDQPARLADQLADQAERAAGYLERSDGAGLLRDLEDFGRKRPWAVIAGGAAFGFAASRLLKSSSADRYRGSTTPAPTTTPTTTSRVSVNAVDPDAAGITVTPAAPSAGPIADGAGPAIEPGGGGLPSSAPFVADGGSALPGGRPVGESLPEEDGSHGAL